MTNSLIKTEDLNKIFQRLRTNDPKIKINGTSIKMLPSYFNYVFILNFIPAIAGIYVLTQQNDLKINLGCFFLIGLSLYGIHSQLIFYNKIYINTKEKNILITPNILERILHKPRLIDFAAIQNINFCSMGFGASHIRYVIVLKLKSTQQLKLISSGDRENAEKIVKALLKVI